MDYLRVKDESSHKRPNIACFSDRMNVLARGIGLFPRVQVALIIIDENRDGHSTFGSKRRIRSS